METSNDVGRVARITDGSAPCRIEFRSTGVVLRGSPDGDRPDPAMTVVRDGAGRFYTANADGFPGRIAIWSPEGEYLDSFGSVGQGPGEFANGLALFVDQKDNLHVMEGDRLHLFTPDQQHVRKTVAPAMGGDPDRTPDAG